MLAALWKTALWNSMCPSSVKKVRCRGVEWKKPPASWRVEVSGETRVSQQLQRMEQLTYATSKLESGGDWKSNSQVQTFEIRFALLQRENEQGRSDTYITFTSLALPHDSLAWLSRNISQTCRSPALRRNPELQRKGEVYPRSRFPLLLIPFRHLPNHAQQGWPRRSSEFFARNSSTS
jgi:hypothetical protein